MSRPMPSWPTSTREIQCPTCAGYGTLSTTEDLQALERKMVAGIIERVALEHGITVGDMVGPCRGSVISAARQQAMWEMRRIPDMTLKAIGHYLGERHYSTVIHNINSHAARMGLEVTA